MKRLQRESIRRWLSAVCGAGFLALAFFTHAATEFVLSPPSAVQLGDSPATVIDKLGEPQGMLKQGRKTTFYYDRGMVDFVDGRAVSVDLVSSEEADRIKREGERAEETIRLRAERERQRLTQEGQEELTKRLADASFAKLPAADRLAAWQDFAKRYPYTVVTNYVAEAQAAAAAGQRRRGEQEEQAELQKRVDEIDGRLKQLDADYAASLANWKRNEIDAERAKLRQERSEDQDRLHALQREESTPPAGTNAPPAAPTSAVKR